VVGQGRADGSRWARLLGRLLTAAGASLLATGLLGLSPSAARANGFEADFEAGIAGATRNSVAYPGDSGTRLSLVGDLSSPTVPAFRARVGYRFAGRHLVTALAAPFRVNATGTLDRPTSFGGYTYPAGSAVLAVYRFDSYRLTYRYTFRTGEQLEVAGGITAKMRDAETSLYGPQVRRKTNVGFVPLLNFQTTWRPGGGPLGLVVEGDALAAPQGRAEDILVAGTLAVRSGVRVRAGYRMLEGGADNDEVYTFAWLHYAVVGVEVRL
jgi:hypothetical protein